MARVTLVCIFKQASVSRVCQTLYDSDVTDEDQTEHKGGERGRQRSETNVPWDVKGL